MILQNILLRNFRNYEEREFVFNPGVTVITGPNGSGKTNILEAVYVLAMGKSFRDSDALLARHDSDWWRLSGTMDPTETRDIKFQDNHKSYTINNSVYRRLSAAHSLPVVLFDPDHLMLIHGSPSGRRTYLDGCIARITPGYASILRRYERIVAQRNKLLKQPRVDHDQLFVWDVSLVDVAQTIAARRHDYIQQWNQELSELYRSLSQHSETLEVRDDTDYTSHYGQRLASALKESFERDRLIGSTSHGPHRDDYRFLIDGRDMVHVGSRGEVRTLLLALKQFEARQLETLYKTPPMLLFDDVLSELDETRRRHIIANPNYQYILTSTDETIFSQVDGTHIKTI